MPLKRRLYVGHVGWPWADVNANAISSVLAGSRNPFASGLVVWSALEHCCAVPRVCGRVLIPPLLGFGKRWRVQYESIQTSCVVSGERQSDSALAVRLLFIVFSSFDCGRASTQVCV